jgi:Fur family ferric uptake transcriptional regulator
VIDVLGEQDCCLGAQEIFDRLRARGQRSVGIASVYRTLELLGELGLVQRLEVGGGGARYEPVQPGGEHHHHVVCDDCGRIAAFADAQLEQALEELSRRLDYAIDGHEVVLRGACGDCATAG